MDCRTLSTFSGVRALRGPGFLFVSLPVYLNDVTHRRNGSGRRKVAMTPDIEVPAKLPLSVNERPARHYKCVVGEHPVIKRPERHGGN